MNKKELQKLVEKCVNVSLKNGKLQNQKVAQCVKLLKKLPRAEAIQALEIYVHSLRRTLGQSTLVIESAVRLSAPQVRKITRNLGKEFNISAVKTILNPSLLGGLRIKIGDVVIDDSVSAHIDQLKERISA